MAMLPLRAVARKFELYPDVLWVTLNLQEGG